MIFLINAIVIFLCYCGFVLLLGRIDDKLTYSPEEFDFLAKLVAFIATALVASGIIEIIKLNYGG